MRSLGAFAAVLIGCASAPWPPHDEVAARFKYKVPFERGHAESTAKDRVEVTELWGTRPRIEIGGEYLVVGRYALGSADQGRVCFYLTADNWDNSGYDMDLQWMPVRRGTGTFVLQDKMAGPGWFHVNLNADYKDLADLYFGEGDTLRVAEKPAGRAR